MVIVRRAVLPFQNIWNFIKKLSTAHGCTLHKLDIFGLEEIAGQTFKSIGAFGDIFFELSRFRSWKWFWWLLWKSKCRYKKTKSLIIRIYWNKLSTLTLVMWLVSKNNNNCSNISDVCRLLSCNKITSPGFILFKIRFKMYLLEFKTAS